MGTMGFVQGFRIRARYGFYLVSLVGIACTVRGIGQSVAVRPTEPFDSLLVGDVSSPRAFLDRGGPRSWTTSRTGLGACFFFRATA
jgi:hypothetical protein